MFIKVWNSFDMGVFRVCPGLDSKEIIQEIEKHFNPEQMKILKKIAKEFGEKLGLEFLHNLKRGWENKLLASAKVLTKRGDRELRTKEEITRSLSEDGEIQFFAHRKNGSMALLKKLRKPAHLCQR